MSAPQVTDALKGSGEGDALLGQEGRDELFGGTRQDLLIGGENNDSLRGEDATDIYYFERSNWGRDTMIDASPPRNILRLPDRENFGGAISIVIGSTGDDTITGNDARNDIFDGEGQETDTDNISGAGGGDLLDVQDGAGDDTVSCGEGNDTVYFDEGDVLVVEGACEEQNPI